ncbi:putative secreted protein [Wickerhamomyces ciferrii]|uniref:Secreted protein n=1 Tax=Wickerhamomyces ciferrii (strain ATCC 14091 / BCRC 22168 / CBS 111 / JCM 3599 / NBRC 0793 / NRRL Y-1031 F-60-10) TaxID=1206466 RepID=K0KHW1_WICCF|nr:uncharacterized protein BN7_277 [Wickerhamomyces ciferrii]CCH40743.1 putative secreted protein [Wickerhamomyces ciferrii]
MVWIPYLIFVVLLSLVYGTLKINFPKLHTWMYNDSFNPEDGMTFKVRPILISFWRVKVFLYHVRFWVSNKIGWIGIRLRKINNSLHKLKSTKSSTIETTISQDQLPSTFGDMFPFEIWDRITDYDKADIYTLTRLNKAFCKEFTKKL